MNYYVAKYEWIYIIGSIPVAAVLILALLFLTERTLYRFGEKIRPELQWIKIRVTISVLLSIVIIFSVFFKSSNYFLNGKMKRCYILENNNGRRLSVWFARKQSANMHDVYTHRFISFNIETGEELGRINPVERYYYNDFRWYGPFGINAWGYSDDTNLQFMDLYKPEIVYNNKEILNKIPELGKRIKLAPYRDVYDINSNEIAVANADGFIYWITPSLSAIKAIERNSNRIKVFRKTGKAFPLKYKKNFINLNGRKWVCKSSPESSDCDLIYIDYENNELNRISLSKIFNKETRLFSFLKHKDAVYIFVSREGYSLSAIKTDSKTGGILKKIEYF